jgi:hypothetical protein
MKTITLLIMTLTLVFGLCAVSFSETPYQGDGHLFVKASELEWNPIASMPAGAKMALIEGDLSMEEPFTFRLKLPADYQVAPHVHPAYERVTVLSGTFHFAHGEEFDRDTTQALKPGDMAIMAPGEPMFGYTEEETVIQLHGTGPWGIEYINPEDDPRN